MLKLLIFFIIYRYFSKFSCNERPRHYCSLFLPVKLKFDFPIGVFYLASCRFPLPEEKFFPRMKSDIHSGNRRSHDEQFETKTIKYQRQTTIGYIHTQIIINMAFVNAVKYHFSDLPISVEETCSMRP